MSYRQEPLPQRTTLNFLFQARSGHRSTDLAAPYFNSTYAFVCQFWSVAFEMNYISYFKQAAIVHILLEKGADINAKGGDLRQSPLYRFVERPPRHRPHPPSRRVPISTPRRIPRQCLLCRFVRRLPRYRPHPSSRRRCRYQCPRRTLRQCPPSRFEEGYLENCPDPPREQERCQCPRRRAGSALQAASVKAPP